MRGIEVTCWTEAMSARPFRCQASGEAVGRRSSTLLAQSLPPALSAMGKESRKLRRHASPGLRHARPAMLSE